MKKKAPVTVPPESSAPSAWAAHTKHGLQRVDATPAGRLVRLAEVVEWLMEAQELPCADAVERVCASLEGAPQSSAWLFLLDAEGGYATALTADHSFAFEPIVSFWDSAPERRPCDVGLPGAMHHMRAWWGKSVTPSACDYVGADALEPLAIYLHQAVALWSYGVKAESATAASVEGLSRAWTDERLLALLKDKRRLEDSGVRDSTKQLADREGVSDSLIREKLRAAKALESAPEMRSKKSRQKPVTFATGLGSRRQS